MAGWFTHLLIAQEALKKLPKSKRSFLSAPEHLDDYLFGSIAPDIRYVSNNLRDVTHEPKGEKSAFEAFDSSTPFVAGYESHLVVDKEWNEVVNFFHIDSNNIAQKFALYFAVDRYFKAKSGWLMPVIFSGNIANANDIALLESLGFDARQISEYKALMSGYLIAHDAISFTSFLTKFPIPIDERVAVEFLDALVIPTRTLNRFFKNSAVASTEKIAKNF